MNVFLWPTYHLWNFLTSKFDQQKFDLHQSKSRIHVNAYIFDDGNYYMAENFGELGKMNTIRQYFTQITKVANVSYVLQIHQHFPHKQPWNNQFTKVLPCHNFVPYVRYIPAAVATEAVSMVVELLPN